MEERSRLDKTLIMRNLIIDIGNSSTKLAVFESDNLLEKKSCKSGFEKSMQGLISAYSPTNAIVSSVREVDEDWLIKTKEQIPLIALSSATNLPLKILYSTPETLGSDRIAGAVEAHHRFPENNVLVIDSGTCITYDMVTINGEYLGGQISPGYTMRYRAMHHFTKRLPRARHTDQIPAVGKSTHGSLQSGAFWGIVHELDGFVRSYSEKYENLKVLITGGNSSLFVTKMKYEIFAVPDLIIMGLNQILRYNVEGSI